jgi:hypothetical protein
VQAKAVKAPSGTSGRSSSVQRKVDGPIQLAPPQPAQLPEHEFKPDMKPKEKDKNPWQGLPPLTKDQKIELIGDINREIPLAYTAFVEACHRVQDSLRAMAKAEAEALALLAEVAMGFLAPGLGKAGGALLGKVVSKIPISGEGVEIFKAGATALFKSQEDFAKAAVAGVTKMATTSLKNNSLKLFGETDTDKFLSKLRMIYQAAFNEAGQACRLSTPDSSLVATWAAFHPDVANEETYLRAIQRLIGQFELVEGLGLGPKTYKEGRPMGYGTYTQETKLVKIADLGNRLASVFFTSYGGQFQGWVDDDFKTWALQKVGGDANVPAINSYDVMNVPGAKQRPAPSQKPASTPTPTVRDEPKPNKIWSGFM